MHKSKDLSGAGNTTSIYEGKNVDGSSNYSPYEIRFQSKLYMPRLGTRGLQLVKLLESLVRLNLLEVDKKLCETEMFSVLLDLLFHYPQNSLLHLSIQR